MAQLELALLTVLAVTCHGFWWSSGSSGQSDDSNETPTTRQIPMGYFRSFSYQPILAFPPPMFPRYYNPFLNWPQDMVSTPHALGAQALYAPTPIASQFRPVSASPFLNKITNPILSSNSDVPNPAVAIPITSSTTTTTTTTTTPAPPTTTSSTFITTTEPATTNPTTAIPSATQSFQSVQYLDPQLPISYNLQSQPSDKVGIVANRRNAVPIFNRLYPQTINDPLTQRYFSNYLASNGAPLQHVQFVPCMCPIALGIPVPAATEAIQSFDSSLPELAVGRRSDDDDDMQSAHDEQMTSD